MSLLRYIVRLAIVAVMVVLGLLIIATVFPFLGVKTRAWANRTWSRTLMAVIGVKVLVRGQPCLDAPVLWIANHVSWLDIYVLNSVRATSFVAKAEIRRWPVIGWLVAGAGTVFIDRKQRQAVQTASQAMRERFARGEAVGLFPEGTTSPGFDLRPFHSSLFEPARHVEVMIQPVALRFLYRGQRSDYAAFVGEQTLMGNAWKVFRTTGLAVEAVFLPPLQRHDDQGKVLDRGALSAQAHRAILAEIREPAHAPAAGQDVPPVS
ncbi:lysophospholipid acyltransferase family protein [Orrella sp. JC864]|uniref:lysophospholipid acyltransferase family protein n=1 Tax=Orrella sp. JC864 TaxID=3120298 RepID=UPI001429BB34